MAGSLTPEDYQFNSYLWRVDPEQERSTRPKDAYDVVDPQDMYPVADVLGNLTHAEAQAIVDAQNKAVSDACALAWDQGFMADHAHVTRQDNPYRPKPETEPEKRARVQGDFRHPRGHRPGGTVAWSEHVEAWNGYHARYPSINQDAQRIHDRGGFGYWEMTNLMGHEPVTWRPN